MRSTALFAAVWATLIAGGCVTVSPSAVRVTLTPKEMAAAQKAISRELRDPDSARFGPMIAARDDANGRLPPALIVCGWINSKNALGGYVGETGFAARLEERPDGTMVPLMVRIQDNFDHRMLVQIICTNAGLGLPPRY